MKKQYAILMAATFLGLAFIGQAEARDQIRIVGSSTVYPFSSYTAEALGSTTKFKTPVVESTGSGGGMKLFCAGTGMNTPDITNASRRMKSTEYKKCQENGVKDITEIVVGYDGIAIAQSKTAAAIDLTRKELLLAVAAKVPNKDESALVNNPYYYWNEINARLPHRKITIYGPPTSSGTRDAFEDMILKHNTKHWKVYNDAGFKNFHAIRQDGVYVPSGENDNLIVRKLTKDTTALGIFGYSYLAENTDKISAATVEGVAPAPETVQDGSYKLSRSLYFYIKQSHIRKVPGILEYANLFMNERMIGDEGECTDIGLIPLPKEMRDHYRSHLKSLVRMKPEDFEKKQ